MHDKKIIIFDFDQTLVETSKRHYMVYRILSEKYKLRLLDYETYWSKRKQGFSNSEVMKEQGLHNLYNSDYEWKNLIEQNEYLKFDEPYEYSKKYLEQLSAKYRLWLVSLRSKENSLFEELKWLRWKKYFKKIMQIKHSKDNVKSKVERVKKALDSSDSIVAWIGDGIIDQKAAENLRVNYIDIKDSEFKRKIEKLL